MGRLVLPHALLAAVKGLRWKRSALLQPRSSPGLHCASRRERLSSAHWRHEERGAASLIWLKHFGKLSLFFFLLQTSEQKRVCFVHNNISVINQYSFFLSPLQQLLCFHCFVGVNAIYNKEADMKKRRKKKRKRNKRLVLKKKKPRRRFNCFASPSWRLANLRLWNVNSWACGGWERWKQEEKAHAWLPSLGRLGNWLSGSRGALETAQSSTSPFTHGRRAHKSVYFFYLFCRFVFLFLSTFFFASLLIVGVICGCS